MGVFVFVNRSIWHTSFPPPKTPKIRGKRIEEAGKRERVFTYMFWGMECAQTRERMRTECLYDSYNA